VCVHVGQRGEGCSDDLGRVMTRLPEGRARWLAGHILPHEPALRGWLRSRAEPGEIDDVVQETYAILAGLASVAQIHNPRAYMFQVAQTVVLQRLRRAAIVRIDAVEEIERLSISNDEPSPEQLVSDRQELRQVAMLIASLPPKCRQAFLLRKVDGLSQREIAHRMGVSEGTVEKHIAKGVRLLMDAMAATANGSNRSHVAERTHRRRRR
jgi:RNA polymerase sigma factor (sigma-70 family)